MAFTDAQLQTLGVAQGAIKGSRIKSISSNAVANVTGVATPNVEFIGDGTNGRTFLSSGRMVAMEVFGTMSTAGTTGATFSIAAYKNSIAAGNKVFEIVLDLTTTANLNISVVDTTVNNPGTDSYVIGDELFIEGVGTAAGGAFRGCRVELYCAENI